MPAAASRPANSLSHRIAHLIRAIPHGTVATYGQIAALAGNPRAARAVVWVLRRGDAHRPLPWHRVINARGSISLPRGDGFEVQRALLEDEGISVDSEGRVDLKQHLWTGS
ncbi:MAG TPA: methylated-DNA--[protein]-cysteine S-methyltransferase [Alkalispirochaeta sp.]|nr:methylated-DNA--[protein]-cysteine S-methyltransferase [Alkalispirochaeta sp.]